MRFTDDSLKPGASDDDATETRMRRALGLSPDTSPARPGLDYRRARPAAELAAARRPADGSESLRDRLAAAEDTLARERTERAGIQRALTEAQATIQQLRTQLAHLEIAAAEALAQERKAVAAERVSPPAEAPPEPVAADALPPRRRGRPAGSGKANGSKGLADAPAPEAAEPEPVQWWLPEFRARKKG